MFSYMYDSQSTLLLRWAAHSNPKYVGFIVLKQQNHAYYMCTLPKRENKNVLPKLYVLMT